MDISSLGITGVAVITVICFLVGQVVKATGLDNKWIPIICGAFGAVLGLSLIHISERSELETAIYEAALHRDDELIAKRRIIDKWAEMDIAAELGWERSTVSKHIPYILNEVKRVANRITKLKGVGN